MMEKPQSPAPPAKSTTPLSDITLIPDHEDTIISTHPQKGSLEVITEKPTLSTEEKLSPPSPPPPASEEPAPAPPPPPGTFVIYGRLLKYTGRRQKIAYLIGALAAAGSGACLPLMTILFQRFVNTFNDFSTGKLSRAGLEDDIQTALSWLCYLFIGKLVLTYCFLLCFSYAGTKVTQGLRLAYLTSILHGPISYFDTHDTSSVSSAVTTSCTIVEKGVSEKVGFCIQNLATTLSALTIALVWQWKLSLVIIALIPILAVVVPITYVFYLRIEAESIKLYEQLTGIETEALAAMRTVKAFGMIPEALRKHQELVEEITKHGLRASPIVGFQIGVVQVVTLGEYALSFWYGLRLYLNGEVDNVGTIVLVFFALLIGFNGFTYISGQMVPLANAISAAIGLFESIDEAEAGAAVFSPPTSPPASGSTSNASISEKPRAREPPKIEYRNVTFSYPTRPDVTVLEDFSCTFPAGKTTAVVGRSGSGKSTLVGLLEKWYKPGGGEIFLDGKPLEEVDAKTLRVGIGYVQQNTFLFNDTIRNNIINGLVGSQWEHASDEVKQERVVWACKEACAHGFVEKLSEGYNTSVGERGNNLSSGQKQRIALARSIVADPLILIFDEATSALDNRVQAEVKEALDRISKNRTTINISHRLSTVVNADHILAMDRGVIVEQGTHDKLVEANGMYADMWSTQKVENLPEVDEEAGKEGSIRSRTSGAEDPEAQEFDLLDQDDSATTVAQKSAGLWYCLAEIFVEMRGHWRLYVLAVLSCMVGGASYPLQAYFFGKMVSVFQLPLNEIANRKDFWSLMVFVLAVVVGIGYTVLGFSLIGLQRIIPPYYRHKYFEALISQDISFFDLKSSTTGALINRLAADPNSIQQLTGANIGLVVVGIFNILGSSILVLVSGWKLGLVAIFGVLLPICISGYCNFRQHHWFEEAIEAANTESSSFASEAVGAIKTVQTLTLEEMVFDKYRDIMAAQRVHFLKRNVRAFAFSALSQCIDLLGMALILWYGMRLTMQGEYASEQLFTVFIATTFSAQDAGSYLAQLPDARLAQLAARRIRMIRKSSPPIERNWKGSDALPSNLLDDASPTPLIEFRNVSFAYASAPDVVVLKDLNLKVHTGQFIAFVGASGCGKSTTFSLLERFYDPTAGEILINGVPLKSLDLHRYRQQISMISQEPVLFSGSIRQNLLTGSPHEGRPATETDSLLEETCKNVHVYDFVASLPEQFNTECTAGTSQSLAFSSGQTQRLAAARVLLREPALLLLDEATSALDAISEKALQGVLHDAGKELGRTVVAIAHRLETVRNADLICVFHEGRIIEQGKHEELMRKGGRYSEMVQA